MEKRKINYNHQFLAGLVRRVTAHGRCTKSQVVDAMNTQGNAKKATLTLLQKWSKQDAYVPIDRIINLVNNMDGVELGDFFVYDDGTPADITPMSRRTKPQPDGQTDDDPAALANQLRLDMLNMRIEHEQEKRMLTEQAKASEDALREDYEERLAAMKAGYEKRLADQERLMQQTIDSQVRLIELLQTGTKKDGDHHPYLMAANDGDK